MSDSGPLSVSGGVFSDLRVSPEHPEIKADGAGEHLFGISWLVECFFRAPWISQEVFPRPWFISDGICVLFMFLASWGRFGIMGCLKKRPGVKKFGRLRAVLEASWAILRQSWSVVEPILEALLGHLKPSWAVLKVSWAVLRPSSAVLGHSSAVLERPAAIVTALVACLGCWEAILDAVESARDV